jgi:hypothetical protein
MMGGVVGYTFERAWEVPATASEVADVVVDLERYPDWWPQIRAVASLGPDTARVLVRATLPVTLDLVLEAVSREPPVLEVALGGDLDGWARWGLTDVPGGTRCDYRQEVTASGAVALASYVARPLLVWNHRRAMAGCERGLRERLGG